MSRINGRMTAHDVRHLRICKICDKLGDGRQMLTLPDGQYHDYCLVERLTTAQILRLPAKERSKITFGAARPALMRKLLDAYIE